MGDLRCTKYDGFWGSHDTALPPLDPSTARASTGGPLGELEYVLSGVSAAQAALRRQAQPAGQQAGTAGDGGAESGRGSDDGPRQG